MAESGQGASGTSPTSGPRAFTRAGISSIEWRPVTSRPATPAGDLKIYLPRERCATIVASSGPILKALGKRVVFE